MGFRFAVESFDPREAGVTLALLDGFDRVPAGSADTVLPLSSGPAALAALIGTINLRVVAAAEGALLLHAGGLSRPDGQVAVICGPSGSGKSTLTAVLLGRGLAYVTDETVCLDPQTLRITPFRKPLSLKRGSWHLFASLEQDAAVDADDQWLLPPARLGCPVLPEVPLAPALVVFPTYAAGQTLRVERLPPAESAYLCGGNSSRLQYVRGGGLPALARLARRAPAYRLVHGDVHAAADTVLNLWDRAA